MITIHDLDEIETGDTIGYLKTPEIYALEAKAEERVFNNLPTHLQEPFGKLMNEYKSQTSKEANFVKAIDRIEPLFQTYSQFGKTIFSINKTRLEDSIRIKDRFIRPFPVLYRYYTVLQQQMVDEGYFHKE
jgi:5'-deoxynucleotidase YfbR-like HD superfamily hydrolase